MTMLRYVTKGDMVLVAVLFLLSGMSVAGLRTLFSGGRHVVVEVDGRHTLELSLDRNVTEIVRGPAGETAIAVQDGEVSIVRSACPHKYCVRMGKVSRRGEVLICVPNRVVVKITGGGDDDGFDGVTQ